MKASGEPRIWSPRALMVPLALVVIVLGWVTWLGAAQRAPDLARSLPTGQPGARLPRTRSEIDHLASQVRAEPTDTTSLVRLAYLLEQADRPAEAGRYYRRLLVLSRTSLQAWKGLARVYWTETNWDAAAGAWHTVLATAPNDAEAMYGLGAVAARQGDLARAKRWWHLVQRSEADSAFVEQATASLAAIGEPEAVWRGGIPRP